MTSIVGVLNKSAVAIAADSAVTLGDTHKVINSGNKIFTLSKYNPIAIMTYSAASFMETPWEVIIKLYRKNLADKSKAHIEDYANDFIEFIKNQDYLTSEEAQHNNLLVQIFGYYKFCFEKAFSKRILNHQDFDIKDSNTYSLLRDEMKKVFEEASKSGLCDAFKDYKYSDFEMYSQSDFEKFFNLTNSPVPIIIPMSERQSFKEMFFNYLRCNIASSTYTGLVFTGYGEIDIYPAFISIRISGFVDGRLKYFIEKNGIFHISNNNPSCIVPFAQKDVIQTIMDGMYPGFKDIIKKVVNSSVSAYTNIVKQVIGKDPNCSSVLADLNKFDNAKISNSINQTISTLMFENYTKNLIGTVASLGKEDMANMAESFISLTSLIRRMSPREETVGGPIDVAIISKGDGFIWVKRKHYFSPEYNNHFFANYFNL